MPLYEYECEQCRRRTEKIQKFSDPPLAECPYCGGHLERLIHAPAVSFKGGGWYADLYSSSKAATPAKESSNSGTGESTASSTNSASGSSASTTSTPAATSSTTSDKK